jgi:outer membrane receptor protein involved in Fe transport
VTGAKQIELLGLSGIYTQMMSENIPNLRGLATSFGLGYVPGSWMESIQVSKGTSSVLNGFESVSGQINVEYKKPAESERFFLNLFQSSMGRSELNFNTKLRVTDNGRIGACEPQRHQAR